MAQSDSDNNDVPDRFVAAWRRRFKRIGDDPSNEPYYTIWIQGHRFYVDLRFPRQNGWPLRCFTGRASWDGTHMAWTHEIDSDPSPRGMPDRGRLQLDGHTLTETGEQLDNGGSVVEYTEEFTLLSRASEGAGPTLLRLVSDSGSLVGALGQLAGHRVAILDGRSRAEGFVAAYWQRVNDAWKLRAGAGDLRRLKDVPAAGWSLAEGSPELAAHLGELDLRACAASGEWFRFPSSADGAGSPR